MSTATKRNDRETESRASAERDDYYSSTLDALPTPPAKDGEVLRHVAVGKENERTEHKRRIEGWVPVKYGDYPEYYRHILEAETVKPDDAVRYRHDLVLMRLPKAIAERAQDRIRRRTESAMDAADPRRNLNAVPGLVLTDNSRADPPTSSRRATFGSG